MDKDLTKLQQELTTAKLNIRSGKEKNVRLASNLRRQIARLKSKKETK